ncbi:MAG TPA: hypothetical protein VF405_04785, partial [Gammaproteobacteria bacterium]
VVLQVGLASALIMAASELSAVATQWAPAFSYVAAASVVAWLIGTLARAFHDRASRRLISAA